MKKTNKALFAVGLALLLCAGCAAPKSEEPIAPTPAAAPSAAPTPAPPSAGEKKYIAAADFSKFIDQPGFVVVDIQKSEDYVGNGHVPGAVHLDRRDITIGLPNAGTVCSRTTLEKLMGAKGITNDNSILVYDSDGRYAERFLWTMLLYGNENVHVVEGGIEAIKAAGIALTGAEEAARAPVDYVAQERNDAFIADRRDVLSQIDEPSEGVVLVDVRTAKEREQGTIPSSVFIETDGDMNTLRPDLTRIILFGYSGADASPLFVRLYDAGYRNMAVYDEGWAGWYPNPKNPVDNPSSSIAEGRLNHS